MSNETRKAIDHSVYLASSLDVVIAQQQREQRANVIRDHVIVTLLMAGIVAVLFAITHAILLPA